MSLRVKHILHLPITPNLQLRILRKHQIQILQRLRQPKTLHLVNKLPRLIILRLHNTLQSRISSLNLTHPVQCLKCLPCPVLVFAITGGAVGVVKTFDGLGAKDVLSVCVIVAAFLVEGLPFWSGETFG